MNAEERNRSSVSDHIATSADQLGETAARAGEGLRETVDNIGKKINGVRDSVTGKTKEYSNELNTYVGKNPWVAIGITAGFAFLVGILIGRSRHESPM